MSTKYKNILLEVELINLDVQEMYINSCDLVLQPSGLWHNIIV